MKASLFNLYENIQYEEIVLFNTLHGSITIWNKEGFQIAKQLLDNLDFNALDEKTKLVMDTLVEGKYIIDDIVNEIEIIENRKACGMKDDHNLDVVIVPNMACNFACPYCFETHIPDSFMTDENAESIKRWLKKQIPKHKTLSLNWFGGEPLLSFERIISMSNYVNEICTVHDVKSLISITTNGYLLDKTRIKGLLDVGIYNYHITVDGPPEFHNKTRVLKDGTGSFLKIFENILLLVEADDSVHICLRVNFNHNNIHAIPDLLQLFPEEIRPRLSVLYEPIFGKKSWSAKDNISAEKISSEMINNYHLAQQIGYNIFYRNIEVGKSVYCPSEKENHFVFHYNGDIFKCNANLNSKERFGYINSEGEIVRNKEQWDKWAGVGMFGKKCYSCKYLPLCMGGCRNMRLSCDDPGGFCTLIPHYISIALKTSAYDFFV